MEKEKADLTQIEENNLMSFTYWAKVKNVDIKKSKVELIDIDNGNEFSVQGEDLINCSSCADQYTMNKKSTRTNMVEILASARNVPFTVIFVKKDGNLRTLRGRLIGVDSKNLGYINVEDLDIEDGNRFRLVDCRTIKELILEGVRYYV